MHHRKPICLSLVSTDLPIWSGIETVGTLYQKDQERFHLLLTEPIVEDRERLMEPPESAVPTVAKPRLLWLEISPYRVIMTMQGNGQFSYRHLWEQGVYGLSRYWLQNDLFNNLGQLRLRNFTRNLTLKGRSLPQSLYLEYELWSDKVQLGCYILNLEIHH